MARALFSERGCAEDLVATRFVLIVGSSGAVLRGGMAANHRVAFDLGQLCLSTCPGPVHGTGLTKDLVGGLALQLLLEPFLGYQVIKTLRPPVPQLPFLHDRQPVL